MILKNRFQFAAFGQWIPRWILDSPCSIHRVFDDPNGLEKVFRFLCGESGCERPASFRYQVWELENMFELKYNYYFTHVYIIYLFKLLYMNSICMFFKYLSKSGWKMLKPHDSADLVDPPRLPLSHMPDVCAKPRNQRQIRGFHWGFRKPTMDDQHFARSAEPKTGLEYCYYISIVSTLCSLKLCM